MIEAGEWLVVIDRQRAFANQSESAWACKEDKYAEITPQIMRLQKMFEDRVMYTRYIAPQHPSGAWKQYFACWSQFLTRADDPIYDLTDECKDHAKTQPVFSAPTFSKWTDEVQQFFSEHNIERVVLCGVATDCCVISTALAMADAGIFVRIAQDACAGSTPEHHERAISVMKLFSPMISIANTREICRWNV